MGARWGPHASWVLKGRHSLPGLLKKAVPGAEAATPFPHGQHQTVETRRGWGQTQAPGRQGPQLERCQLTTAPPQAAAPGRWLALNKCLLEVGDVAVGPELRGSAES